MSPSFPAEVPYKWDRPSNSYNPENRPSTPSSLVSSSFFSSTTDRFKYHGRQLKERIPTPPPSDGSPASSSRKNVPRFSKKVVVVDPRSSTILGMTFARAMGFDKSVHSPVGRTRDLLQVIPPDFPHYDWRLHDAKRVRELGYAMDKVGRPGPGVPFFGEVWRGCASLEPNDLNLNPGFYAPGGQALDATSTKGGGCAKASGFGLGKSLAPARSSVDARRLNLPAVPKAVGTLSAKLGPGAYAPRDLSKVVLGKVVLESEGRGRQAVKASPAFLGPPRAEFGGPFRGFATTGKTRTAGSGGEGNDDAAASAALLDKYAMYQNVKPLAAERFLRAIKTDEDFHAHMKRVATEGETREERAVVDAILSDARAHDKEINKRGRLASSELILQEGEDGEEDEGEGEHYK